MSCPDPETLEQLFRGALAAAARAEIADHAASCRDCHQLVELLLDSDALATTAASGDDASAAELYRQPRALAPGTKIDRYVIETRIGHGGMGVVYAARDPELGRRIAIKVLRAGTSAERLRREAQALARLSHPNVVAVHDVGEHAGQTFIAMALVDGVTLRTWLETARTIPEIVEVLRLAGRGIAAAHAAGMIHRDLKPDNIFVAHDGGVLVGDFGLAREAHAGDAEIAGTPAYMAPEQAQGAATAASDQFAFCVTAWEALYGERPFAGTTVTTLQASIEAGALREPTDERGVPAKIARALRRGLASDPTARFASVNALLAELAPRRRRWPWIAGALGATGLTVVTALVLRTPAEACDTAHLLDGVRGAPLAGAAGAAIDAYATRWLAARHDVCTTRDELGPAVADARAACLEQRRGAFGAVRASLDATQDPMTALQAIEGLPAIDACTHVAGEAATPARVASHAALSVRLADLRTRWVVTGSPPLAALKAFVDEAERAGDDAILVPALLLVADELAGSWIDVPGAEATIRRALLVAERSRDDHARIETRIELAQTLVRLRRLTEARYVVDEAATVLARYGTDRELELDLIHAQAQIASADGDHAKAIDRLRAYVAGRETTGERAKLEIGYIELSGELASHGTPAETIAVVQKSRALLRTLGVPDVEVQALDSEAVEAQTRGELARALQLEERAFAIVMSAPHAVDAESQALFNLGNAYEMAGEWAKMLSTNEARLPLVPADAVAERAFVTENIGTAHARLGQPDRAIEWLEKAIALDVQAGAPSDPTTAQIGLAGAFVEAGRHHDARVLCETVLRRLVAAAPARPWRQGTVEATLARALWEEADAHERGRALALAGDAERDLVAGIAILETFPNAATSLAIIRARLGELRAWRAHHAG